MMKRITFFLISLLLLIGCKNKSSQMKQETNSIIDGETFVNWIMKDTATFLLDLTERANKAGVKVIESPDKKIRIYDFISGGGTSPDWTTVTQYRSNDGKVKCIQGVPLWGDNSDYTVTDIFVADNIGEQPVYFVEYYSKASSSEGYNELFPLVLQADTFAMAPKFIHGQDERESVSVSYSIPDWYFRANKGDGWNWMFSYIPDKKQLYVPFSDEGIRLTNRYHVYEFDGKYFHFMGEAGPSFLYQGLQKFKMLVTVTETEQHLVRVDLLDNGKYRLALWNNPSQDRQSDEPVLVLDNGIFNEDADVYEFPLKDKLKYRLDDGDSPDLWLVNDENVVSREKARDSFNRFKYYLEYLFSELDEILQGYAAPKLVYITDHYIIRVDSMQDNKYRYTSWQRLGYPSEVTDPDITLVGGEKTDECYIFKNGSFRYEIPLTNNDYFRVYRDRISLYKELIYKSYSESEIRNLSCEDDSEL